MESKKEMLRLKRRAPEKLGEISKISHIEDKENAPVAKRFILISVCFDVAIYGICSCISIHVCLLK